MGKLSVAAFPAVLVVLDLMLEKRRLNRSFIDKIPFLLLAALVSVAVQHAQPSTGLQSDLAMHAKAFVQSLWLLTGLGTYVIYRVPPAPPGDTLSQLVGLGILLGLFLLPLLLRKRYPVATVSIYWILFTYLPTQILPFSYPVTDRYLLLPSVGAVILIAWLLIRATDHLHRWKLAAATTLVTVISFIWLAKTLDYLSEWRDPRSLWFAATQKSDDVHLCYELGWEYREKAATLECTEEMVRCLRKKLNITLLLFGKMIPGFRNCWLNWQRTSIADRLRKSLKDICWPKQKIILTKPSEEKERTLCRTFFLAAESVFSIKVICSLQKKNSWR